MCNISGSAVPVRDKNGCGEWAWRSSVAAMVAAAALGASARPPKGGGARPDVDRALRTSADAFVVVTVFYTWHAT